MKRGIFVLIMLLLGTSVCSAETTWQLAPGRSKLGFRVKHMVFLDVEGRFKKFEGRVIAPGDDLTQARMHVTIAADSVYTGISDRDRHLVGEDFFNTAQFPEITFTSREVIKMDDPGEECYKIIGDLTVRGVTKPIVLMARCVSMKKLPNGKTRMDLVATGTLNRFDYQLQWNELLETGKAIVGENVNLDLKIALMK